MALTRQQKMLQLLPLVVSSKLLLPLTGIFVALFITTTWQADLTIKLTPLTPGYEYLGAVGLVAENALFKQTNLVSQQINYFVASALGEVWAWPARAQSLTAAIATTGSNVVFTFKQSVESFKQGVVEIYSQIKNSITNIFHSFNQTFFDLYDNLLSGVGFLSNQIEVVVDGFFRPVKTSTTSGWQESVATVAAVNAGYNKFTADIVTAWSEAKVAIINWWQIIVKSWHDFIGGLSADTTPALQVDQEVKADVKEIKQDVKSLIKAFNEQGNTISKPSRQGMVVVPSTGVAETDAQMKARIANMFSDPVQVKLDAGGQAGIITPTFTEGDSGDYLFLLAPIKQ
ncbi:MAG: hypothetical protein Q7T49_00165 [bacterium]|nr:hypothetical protein [bacterium]